MNVLEKVIGAISEQQKGKENTAPYFVGEQLKDICRTTPGAADIVLQDLDVPEMSIEECEKKIKELADKRHKENKGNCVFISPLEAENIIREFYGIPEADETTTEDDGFINIDSFI